MAKFTRSAASLADLRSAPDEAPGLLTDAIEHLGVALTKARFAGQSHLAFQIAGLLHQAKRARARAVRRAHSAA